MVLGLFTKEMEQFIYISNDFNEAKRLYIKQSQHHMLHLHCNNAHLGLNTFIYLGDLDYCTLLRSSSLSLGWNLSHWCAR